MGGHCGGAPVACGGVEESEDWGARATLKSGDCAGDGALSERAWSGVPGGGGDVVGGGDRGALRGGAAGWGGGKGAGGEGARVWVLEGRGRVKT